MTLYEKFGWIIPIESYLKTLEYAKLPPKFDYIIPDEKQGVASSACNVAICYYLLGRRAEAARFGRETVSAVLDFFYGSWKERVPTDLKTLDVAW